jgi:hypothetical protein
MSPDPEIEDQQPEPDARPEPDPLAWVQEARTLFRLVRTEGMAVLRRKAPDLLDQVSELAGGLAATLRAMDAGLTSRPPDADDPADNTTGPASRPASTPARPPSTVRIDVTD